MLFFLKIPAKPILCGCDHSAIRCKQKYNIVLLCCFFENSTFFMK